MAVATNDRQKTAQQYTIDFHNHVGTLSELKGAQYLVSECLRFINETNFEIQAIPTPPLPSSVRGAQ